MPRRKPAPPRAERVYTPPADLLLTEDDLRAWLAAIVPTLVAAGFSKPDPSRAVLRQVSPPDWTVSGWPEGASGGPMIPKWTVARPRQLELSLHVDAPAWTPAHSLDLRLSADGDCGFRQRTQQQASARAVHAHLRERAPRWQVPPQGSLPFALGLRECNGWEGEGWTYWLPLAAEADVLALATGSPVALGRDVRCTPFDPPSLAAFGSWRLELRYAPEWRACYCAETSRCGYMPYQNWAGDAAPDLAALVAEARERGILRWRDGDEGAGLSMWKGRAELHGEDGATLRAVCFA